MQMFSPWHIQWNEREPKPLRQSLDADLVVVGAGFTGLAVAYHAARLLRDWRIVVLEAERVGGGASGCSGGVLLQGTAKGVLPGTENAIEALSAIISETGIACNLRLPGCYNVARRPGQALVSSPRWSDSGLLCAVAEEPGGDFDPGLYLSGLAEAVAARGVALYEKSRVTAIEEGDPLRLLVGEFKVLARRIVLATNALSLHLMNQHKFLVSYNTFAIATEPIPRERLAEGWWDAERPFYTLDLPYLWGRTTAEGRIIVGAGLEPCDDGWSVCRKGQTHCEALAGRLRRLHPAFAEAKVSHRWWGPICFSADLMPYVIASPQAPNVYFVGADSGHGVALSALLGLAVASHLAGDDAPLRAMPWLARLPRKWLWSPLKRVQLKASLALSRWRPCGFGENHLKRAGNKKK